MRKYLSAILTVVLVPIVAMPRTALFNSSQIQGPLVISGQVVDEKGTPISNAGVHVMPDALYGALPSGISDDQGRFKIQVNYAGRYKLTASKLADGYASLSSTLHNPSDSLPQVIVTVDQPVPFVIVRLGPRAGKITGSVIDATTQRPINNFQIRVCRVEVPRHCHQELFPGTYGRFQILVPTAPIVIEASAEGYRDWQTLDVNSHQPAPLLVASGETRELTLNLRKLDDSDEGLPKLPKLLDAPQPLSPSSGTEFDHYPRVTKLEWSQVPGAVNYSVEIQYCDGLAPKLTPKQCEDPRPWEGRSVPPTSGIEGTTYQFSFLGAQPGRWRVWAHDAQGQAGAKSEWSVFFYRR
jgi:hypothetical protein